MLLLLYLDIGKTVENLFTIIE